MRTGGDEAVPNSLTVTGTAIILAGGFGTRLKEVIQDLPKPMAPVAQRPFLDYLLKYLLHFKIRRVILSTGYLAEKIQEQYGNAYNGMQLLYSHEESPLGTGGGIRLAMSLVNEKSALVLNGDSFFDVDLNDFFTRHVQCGAQASIALRMTGNASRYGRIETDTNHRVQRFQEKSEQNNPGRINGGLYLLEKEVYLSYTPDATTFSIEKDFFSKYIDQIDIRGFEYNAYFIDIGIPEDYRKAQHDFKGFKY